MKDRWYDHHGDAATEEQTIVSTASMNQVAWVPGNLSRHLSIGNKHCEHDVSGPRSATKQPKRDHRAYRKKTHPQQQQNIEQTSHETVQRDTEFYRKLCLENKHRRTPRSSGIVTYVGRARCAGQPLLNGRPHVYHNVAQTLVCHVDM